MRVCPVTNVLSEIAPSLLRHGRVALCQLVRAEGSTPGKTGWKLLVRPDGSSLGNLGGGAFEAMVEVDAKRLLDERRGAIGGSTPAPTLTRYYLTEEATRGVATGMVCGGMAEVLIEILEVTPRLVIAGGGPVGQALARAGELAGFSLCVADDRPEFRDHSRFPAGTSFVDLPRIVSAAGAPAEPAQAMVSLDQFLAAPAGGETAIAVVSRCWETDLAALVAVLGPPPGRLAERVTYLGLMGSARKVTRLRQELGDRGYELEPIELRAPIGLPIGGDTPGEIAIGVLAEILALRHGRALALQDRPPLYPNQLAQASS